MTWAKVDDRANEHQKQLKAGAKACWLWTCGLMYCNRQANKTGRIPKTVVHTGMLFPGLGAKEASRLIEAELWSEDGESYLVHEYERWNPEKKPQHEPGSLGEKRAAAGSKGGVRSGERRREAAKQLASPIEANLLHETEANEANGAKQLASSRTAAPAYALSRALDPPHPTPPQEDPTRRGRSKDLAGWDGGGAAPLPPSWAPPFAAFVGVAFDAETYRDALEQFRAHHVGARTVATESAFFGKLSVWATKLWQERRSQVRASEAQRSEVEERQAREVARWTD